MENLLQQHTVCMSRSVIDRQEECGVSGSFTLPDYCSDMAAVLTCTMVPHLQSRQWSGDRLLIDGAADVRVLYLDEDRCCIHSAEFSLPFSLEVKCDGVMDSVPVSVDLSTRYVNWGAGGKPPLHRNSWCGKGGRISADHRRDPDGRGHFPGIGIKNVSNYGHGTGILR